MREEKVILITCWEFEDMVKEFYHVKEFNFADIEECDNGNYRMFCVQKEKELTNWGKQDLHNFLNGKSGSRIARVLLQDMCNNEYIEPGKYLVDVSW